MSRAEKIGGAVSKFKSILKAVLPDRVLYTYTTLKLFPKYLRAKEELKHKSFPTIQLYSNEKTVDLIVEEGKSLSRFGDGEFNWMMGRTLDSFQVYSKDLEVALREAIKCDDDRLLIGIPGGMIDSSKCNLHARLHWTIIKNRFFESICQFLNEERVYCDASITRPYIDYSDREYSKHCFQNLKRIWNNRDVIIAEGANTKLGMGNDLFDNARTIRRIICPSENAFEKLPDIIDAVQEIASKKDLILAALGPTATVLASRLCVRDYQVIDIGHIDIEYMWYLKHSVLRDPIEGKAVNESGIKECSTIFDQDKEYIRSIVKRVE